MGRRKRGNDVDGWLLVDKPEGVGSTQVVGRARRAYDANKAGHAGTLDPLATGLLAVAFGEATKTVPYAQEGRKTYRFTVRWGEATTSDDREGEVCARSDRRPAPAEIAAALPAFTGTIMQRPPTFSAIKVDGARAYDLARRGETPELAARPIDIHALSLVETPDADSAVFEMVCGKGGYVRSMARDLGEALGTVAHVTTLRRTEAGGFSVADAVPLAALDGPPPPLLPVSAGLAGAPCVQLDPAAAARLSAGDAGAAPALAHPVYWAESGGVPIAILGAEGGRVAIRRVFRFS